jgi:hypothetical protein
MPKGQRERGRASRRGLASRRRSYRRIPGWTSCRPRSGVTRREGPAEIMASPSVATMRDHLVARAHDLGFGGPSCIASDLSHWLESQDMRHTRGKPYHPMGKIERWHLSSKSRITRELLSVWRSRRRSPRAPCCRQGTEGSSMSIRAHAPSELRALNELCGETQLYGRAVTGGVVSATGVDGTATCSLPLAMVRLHDASSADVGRCRSRPL